MPSLKSAHVSERRAQENRIVRSAARTYVAAALRALEAGGLDEAQAAVARAASALDRAAKRGVIHPNNASGRKSRLAKRLQSLSQ